VGHVAAPELPRVGRREPGHGEHGSSGAPLSWEAGAEATGHTSMRARLVFRPDLELVRGVPGLHDNDNAICFGSSTALFL
jgi:hypothetical protein